MAKNKAIKGYAHARQFGMAFAQGLDLSPLGKFMERAPLPLPCGFVIQGGQYKAGDQLRINLNTGLVTRLNAGSESHMYGYIADILPEPEPEKSPIDKAIDDMMAKRKAKREAAPDRDFESIYIGPDGDSASSKEEYQKAKALDRALRNSYPHFQSMTSRLRNGNPLPVNSDG